MPLSTTVSRPLAAFIHRGAWGDLYVSLASLKDVCDRHREVVVVGSKKWLELLGLESWPKIREIWVSEDGRKAERFHREGTGWKSMGTHSLRTLFQIVHTSYNLRTESLRYGWAPLLGGVPSRHGSAQAPWSFVFYTHRAPWLGKDPRIHERDRMLQVIEAPNHIGERATHWKLHEGLPPLKEPDRVNGSTIAGAKAGSYWLFNPTSSRREKAWPAARFKELIRTLHPHLESHGLSWRIIGAPNETAWLKDVLPEGFPSSRHIVQTATIPDLCDVLAGARALVTNTSSMQFLAPGYGVRTLTLIGRGDPMIWGPLGRNDSYILGRIDPKLNERIFEQELAAYESIPLKQVVERCLEILEAKS